MLALAAVGVTAGGCRVRGSNGDGGSSRGPGHGWEDTPLARRPRGRRRAVRRRRGEEWPEKNPPEPDRAPTAPAADRAPEPSHGNGSATTAIRAASTPASGSREREIPPGSSAGRAPVARPAGREQEESRMTTSTAPARARVRARVPGRAASPVRVPAHRRHSLRRQPRPRADPPPTRPRRRPFPTW